jgi:hypothetical protein
VRTTSRCCEIAGTVTGLGRPVGGRPVGVVAADRLAADCVAADCVAADCVAVGPAITITITGADREWPVRLLPAAAPGTR